MPLELSTIPSHTNAPSLHPTISLQPTISRQPQAANGGASLGAENGTTFGGRARMSVKTRMLRVLRMRVVWIGFVLIILAFGTGDCASGWGVTYMLEVKHSPPAAGRYMLSGLWGGASEASRTSSISLTSRFRAGIASGRIVLAYLLDSRLGERTFSIVMLAAAASFLGLLWAIKQYQVNAVMLVLIGFFLGYALLCEPTGLQLTLLRNRPVTPKVLSVISARVPPSLKSSAMSLTIGLGLVGSAVGPLFFGFVAGKGFSAVSVPLVLDDHSLTSLPRSCESAWRSGERRGSYKLQKLD